MVISGFLAVSCFFCHLVSSHLVHDHRRSKSQLTKIDTTAGTSLGLQESLVEWLVTTGVQIYKSQDSQTNMDG